MMLKAAFDLSSVTTDRNDDEAPYQWQPSDKDWQEINSRPIRPSCIVEQEYAPVFHWSNPDGN